MANVALQESQKLISRKMWVIGKLMKFPRTPRNSETYHLLWNFLSTADLGSLIGFWQCKFHSVEYLAIFLPLWFYVKSILAHFRRSKTAVWTILKTLNSNFWKNYTLENVKSSPKFIAAQMAKLAVFGALKWPKLIFTLNLNGRKNCYVVYSQLSCPGL